MSDDDGFGTDSTAPSSEGEDYELEKLLQRRVHRNATQYRVKWVHYEKTSWLPVRKIDSSAVSEFEIEKNAMLQDQLSSLKGRNSVLFNENKILKAQLKSSLNEILKLQSENRSSAGTELQSNSVNELQSNLFVADDSSVGSQSNSIHDLQSNSIDYLQSNSIVTDNSTVVNQSNSIHDVQSNSSGTQVANQSNSNDASTSGIQKLPKHICTICGASFSNVSNLNRHKIRAHKPEEHLCKFCNKTFKCKANLLQHYTKSHKDEFE